MTEPLFRADAYLRDCTARVLEITDGGAIVLDRTVFYPTGGGQPGDTGAIVGDNGAVVRIANTIKGATADEILHVPEPGQVLPLPGTMVRASIDWDRRYAHMRMHTCLHLLSAVLPFPVTGGNVGAEKSRLDFDMEDVPDRAFVTVELNRLIEEDHQVTSDWISDADLEARPELVKTMSVKPPTGAGQVRLVKVAGLDLQPCGGTHVAHTSEIGRVTVSKIEKKGRLNRRVAITFAR